MLCVYAFTKGMMNIIEERKDKKRSRKERTDFFFDSLSDETYLDLIRSKIQFLIDEGYKYSEQLEIINRESGRKIKYDTYTNFVKLFILDKPDNIFQHREFSRHYYNHQAQAPNSKISHNSKINETNFDEDNEPIVKRKINREENISSFEQTRTQAIPKIPTPVQTQTDNSEIAKIRSLKKEVVEQKVARPNRVVFQHVAMPNTDELY